MKIGIVGAGAVGTALARLFPQAALYDEPKSIGRRDAVNACDVAFICVPTPAGRDGRCDTSVVDEVVGWVDAPVIVIRSTVSVGTSRRLARQTGKRIVFQPEYGPAETPDHPFNDLFKVRWIVLGGAPADTAVALRAWQDVYSSDITVMRTTWETAELCKYMENAFLALKVTFCNEFFELAERFDVDYDDLREAWLADPRMGRSHTFVRADSRGFGGRCLPKDLAAIIHSAGEAGYAPDLLREVTRSNERFRRATGDGGSPG